MKDGCEKIQHFGAGKDETGTISEPDSEVSLKNIENTVKDVKSAYAKVERFLRRYYGEDLPALPEKEEEKEEEKKEEEPETKEDKKPVKDEKEKKDDTKEEEPKKK